MQPSHFKDPHAVALGQRGGQQRMKQLNAQERSALASYAARSRWHPQEARDAREKAREITFLIKLALKYGGQLPLI